MHRSIFCLATLSAVVIFGVSDSSASTIEGLHGDAAPAIAEAVSKNEFGDPTTAHVFYGDLSGAGTNDAIVFLYHPSGGNSDILTTWIWLDTDNGYVLARDASMVEVFGIDPHDVRFSPGHVEVAMTVPNPGDPRCCPTGKQKFTLSLDGR